MSASELEKWFRTWYPSLWRYAFRMLKDKEASSDAVQDVFVRIWQNPPGLDSEGAVKAYLFRAVHNACLKEIGRIKPLHELESGPAEPSDGHQSDRLVREDDVQKALDSALDSLPPACKSIFLLSRYENMSYAEIAQNLDLSVKTVENQMGKALRLLKTHLAPFFILFFLLIFSQLKTFPTFFSPGHRGKYPVSDFTHRNAATHEPPIA